MPPLPVLVNPLSGGRPGGKGAVDELFRGAGVEARVQLTTDVGAAARALARERPPLIVAAGGDGTVNAVAAALAGTGIAMAVLPAGTFNHFARDLGIPSDAAAALEIALRGRRRAIDVGEVNGRIFVNNASIGLYPAIVRRREKHERLGFGRLHAMLWSMHTVLRGHPFLHLALKLDGVESRRRTPFVFVGNNVYQMQGFTIGMRERLDAGVLSVYLTQRRGRLGLLRLALRALFGRLEQAADFEASTVSELRIESRHKRLLVATDGEVGALELPLDFRIRPAALQVMAP